MEDIKREANSGGDSYYITRYSSIMPETHKKLEDIGYTVTEEGGRMNDSSVKISWA